MQLLRLKTVCKFILSTLVELSIKQGLKWPILMALLFSSVGFSMASEKLCQQEINYIAPKSATVFLVWDIEGYTHDEAIAANYATKLSDGLLYTQMVAKEDTFSANLNIPFDAIFSYSFWITKNKEGQYEDYWDLQSGGKSKVTHDHTITKNAIYWKKEASKEIQLLRYGWILWLALL